MNNDPYQPPSAPVSASYASADAQISPLVLQHLLRTQPWVRLVSIVGLIGVALMLLLTILGVVGVNNVGRSRLSSAGEAGYMMGPVFVTIVPALLYLYPLIKLSKYAAAIRSLRVSQSMFDLERALDQQRGFWKFVGVLMLISIVFMVIALLGVFGVAFSR